MYYLKISEDIRLNLVEDEMNIPSNEELILVFYNGGSDFDTIKNIFSDIDSITIYGCNVQEDGRETDEYIVNYYDKYTVLKNIEYDIVNDIYRVTLIYPNDMELRIADLEDALNFLLMGGE